MVFVQFFQRAVNSEKIIEACGDRAVIILDARNTRETWHDIAKIEGKKRGYVAYTLNQGTAFTRANPITKMIAVD